MSSSRPTSPLCKYYDLGCKYRNSFLFFFPMTPAHPGKHWLRGYNESVEFALRDFRHEEFETLWRIDQQCFEPGISYSRLELATYLQRPGAFALVADGSQVSDTGTLKGTSKPGQSSTTTVGFIVAEAGGRGSGHIITIDVLPQARGSGIGSQLLRAAEGRLWDAHCQSVILETAVDNKAALSFYKRHHYSVIKTLPRYYSNGVDAFVLKKDLLSPPGTAKLPQGHRAQ
jgi:[ribosomal protein S18]-alanine N-acetyltransferase